MHLRCAVWVVPLRGCTFRAPWYVCTGLSLPLDSGVFIRVYGHMMMMMMMIKLLSYDITVLQRALQVLYLFSHLTLLACSEYCMTSRISFYGDLLSFTSFYTVI